MNYFYPLYPLQNDGELDHLTFGKKWKAKHPELDLKPVCKRKHGTYGTVARLLNMSPQIEIRNQFSNGRKVTRPKKYKEKKQGPEMKSSRNARAKETPPLHHLKRIPCVNTTKNRPRLLQIFPVIYTWGAHENDDGGSASQWQGVRVFTLVSEQEVDDFLLVARDAEER
jgi:hypothetical protein